MDYKKISENLNIERLIGIETKAEKEFKERVNKYKLEYNSLTELDKKTINQILDQKNIYKEIIDELTNNKINCSLSLVGGTIRDLIVRKTSEIKDFDFLLTIEDYQDENIFKYCEKNKIFFDKTEVPTIQKSGIAYMVTQSENINKIKELNLINARTAITSHLLKKLNIKYQLFENKDIEQKYLNKRISSIFKIKDKNGKENDLIISGELANSFVTSFDFEICKCYIDLVSSKQSINYNNFLENIICLSGMLRDIEEKTITIKIKNFNLEEIEYFMSKHYLKLKEKFPEHKLNYFETKTDKDKTKELIYLNYLILEEQTKKDKNIKIIKNKI